MPLQYGSSRSVRGRFFFPCVLSLVLSTAALFGQHSTVPVLLVNGFQTSCPDGGVSGTFGSLPAILLNDGAAEVDFFDVCSANGASIETLAGILTAKLQSYPGPVDVIAHSMGGLVVRAYLQGWTTSPYLTPPANPKIRKLVLLGTPNFGVSNNFAVLWSATQVTEMQFGSPLLWYLATWNQLYDDLRGVDTLAIVGTAGNTLKGVAWDGVVDVSSASISFADLSGLRTRVVPYCHSSSVNFLLCAGVENIAEVNDRSHLSYQLLRSFLDGTSDWTTITPPVSATAITGGLLLALADATGVYGTNQLTAASLLSSSLSYPLDNPVSGSPVWFSNAIAPGTNYSLSLSLAGQQFSVSGVSISPGQFLALPLKFGPAMRLAISSAGVPPGALSVAPDSLISIYGSGLASGVAQASALPLPFRLADATLTLGGLPLRLLYVSSQQINALVPSGLAPGLYPLVLTTSQGKHSMNVMVELTVPTLFALTANTAAALHATTGQVVTSSNPVTSGEYVSLFGTGLGPTASANGLNVAQTAPTVFVDGQPAAVTFAGRAPGFSGLDQINAIIPAGVRSGASVSVVILSGTRRSNTVLLPIR